MHAAAGRQGGATVDCTREGVEVWLVGEVIVQEIVGATAERVVDPATGFGGRQVRETSSADRLPFISGGAPTYPR